MEQMELGKINEYFKQAVEKKADEIIAEHGEELLKRKSGGLTEFLNDILEKDNKIKKDKKLRDFVCLEVFARIRLMDKNYYRKNTAIREKIVTPEMIKDARRSEFHLGKKLGNEDK
jgi:hypothetical protein